MTATLMASAPYPVLRRSALATAAVFALSGLASASWVSRLPEIRHHLHASPGTLGIALLGSAIGALIGAPITGRAARRFGSRRVVMAATGLACLGLIGTSLVRSPVQLGIDLLFFGVGYGSWDVAMNIHGQGVESAAGKAWMPRYHASWSVGSFAGAGIGTLASALHVPIEVHVTVAAAACFGLVCLALRLFLADEEAHEQRVERRAAPPQTRLLTARFVALGVVMIGATLVEGAASDWIGIYFDDVRSLSPAAGSAGFTTFTVAMALSRAGGTWTIEALGRARAVRVSGLVALAGVSLLLLSPLIAGAYAGALLWGLGVAIVFPAVVSAAGDTPGRSAEAISLVTSIGYSGFLFGPPLIGMLANATGLGHALWLVGALAVAIVALAGYTGPGSIRRRPPASGT